MLNPPSADRLAQLPRLYETEEVPLKDKVIHLKFSIFDCQWFISEFDGDDLFFGFAILNDDHLNSEWGYISFNELKSLSYNGTEVLCDPDWQVKRACCASEIPDIKV